jgi:hypothetical protein
MSLVLTHQICSSLHRPPFLLNALLMFSKSLTLFFLAASALVCSVTANGIPGTTPADKIVACLSPNANWKPVPYSLIYLVGKDNTWSMNGALYSLEVLPGHKLALKAAPDTVPAKNIGTEEAPVWVHTRTANHVFQVEFGNKGSKRYWLQVTKDQKFNSQCTIDMAAGDKISDVGVYEDM